MRQLSRFRGILNRYSRAFLVGAASYHQAFYPEPLSAAETETLTNEDPDLSENNDKKQCVAQSEAD